MAGSVLNGGFVGFFLHCLERWGLGILLFLEDLVSCVLEDSPVFPAEFYWGQHEDPDKNKKEGPEEEVAQPRKNRLKLHFEFFDVDLDGLVDVGEGDGLMVMLIGVGESNSNEEGVNFLLEDLLKFLFLEKHGILFLSEGVVIVSQFFG